MTEDEAKQRWCPFARDSNTGGNRLRYGAGADDAPPPEYGSEAAAEFPCIASACMAWRTRQQWFDNAQEEPMWVSYPPYAFEPGPGQEREDGFCGLAGAPQ